MFQGRCFILTYRFSLVALNDPKWINDFLTRHLARVTNNAPRALSWGRGVCYM